MKGDYDKRGENRAGRWMRKMPPGLIEQITRAIAEGVASLEQQRNGQKDDDPGHLPER